jgi:excisionase family DNA binding protein
MFITRQEEREYIEAFKKVAEFAARVAIRHAEQMGKRFEAPNFDAPVEPLIYNRKQAAAALNVSVSTLDRLVIAGEIKPIMVSGRAPRYDPKDIELLLRRKHGMYTRD